MEHAVDRVANLRAAAEACLEGRPSDPNAVELAWLVIDALGSGLLAPAPLREGTPIDEPEEWRCPGCNSDRWVRASLTRGFTVITQCVPCGRYVNCPPPDRADADGRTDQ